MRPILNDWRDRIGRRGAFLLFLAMLDVLVAGSFAWPPKEVSLSSGLRYVAGIAPLWVWAGAWLAAGVCCAVGAFLRVDRWSFAAAMALKVLWGSLYLLGWAFGLVERGWVQAAIWLAFAAVVLLISTWAEPPTPSHPVVDDGR